MTSEPTDAPSSKEVAPLPPHPSPAKEDAAVPRNQVQGKELDPALLDRLQETTGIDYWDLGA